MGVRLQVPRMAGELRTQMCTSRGGEVENADLPRCHPVNHTLEQARFCTRCGQPLKIAWNVRDQLDRLSCQSCGFIHYDSPKVLVWCLAHCNERVLFCRRAVPPAVGLWR